MICLVSPVASTTAPKTLLVAFKALSHPPDTAICLEPHSSHSLTVLTLLTQNIQCRHSITSIYQKSRYLAETTRIPVESKCTKVNKTTVSSTRDSKKDILGYILCYTISYLHTKTLSQHSIHAEVLLQL